MHQGSATTRCGIRNRTQRWAATAAGEHASPHVTERGYEPSVASCVAAIWHQLVVQFRLMDGVAVMNKLRRCLKPRLPAWWLAVSISLVTIRYSRGLGESSFGPCER